MSLLPHPQPPRDFKSSTQSGLCGTARQEQPRGRCDSPRHEGPPSELRAAALAEAPLGPALVSAHNWDPEPTRRRVRSTAGPTKPLPLLSDASSEWQLTVRLGFDDRRIVLTSTPCCDNPPSRRSHRGRIRADAEGPRSPGCLASAPRSAERVVTGSEIGPAGIYPEPPWAPGRDRIAPAGPIPSDPSCRVRPEPRSFR